MKEVFEPRHLALGVLAIALATILLWWLLQRAAGKARRHFNALLELAQNSLEAQTDVALARRRLTALRLVVNAAKYALTISALLMSLRWLGVPLDSLLLPAGFLGAALGLGAQNMVRDIVAGLFIVFEGQFAVGDVVSINETVGTVDEIGLRVTRLRAETGHLHYFPNGAINAVEKYPRGHVLLRLCVPVAASTPQRESGAPTPSVPTPGAPATFPPATFAPALMLKPPLPLWSVRFVALGRSIARWTASRPSCAKRRRAKTARKSQA